jgi:CRP/FNR family cyclic AMP-dependent transcriptional regulator
VDRRQRQSFDGAQLDGLPTALVQLDAELRERAWDGNAGGRLPARALQLPPGRLDVGAMAAGEGLGLLILDGLLLGELGLGRARVGWLLGSGDLLRPWELDELALTSGARWQALRPSRIALLDDELHLRIASPSRAMLALLEQATRTSQWLMASSLIVAAPLVEERLIMLFAMLGERWGKVTPDGVLLELPLTHQALACLCGSRRPSVTLALQALRREGLVERISPRAWLLHRDVSEAYRRHPECTSGYAQALGFG